MKLPKISLLPKKTKTILIILFTSIISLIAFISISHYLNQIRLSKIREATSNQITINEVILSRKGDDPTALYIKSIKQITGYLPSQTIVDKKYKLSIINENDKELLSKPIYFPILSDTSLMLRDELIYIPAVPGQANLQLYDDSLLLDQTELEPFQSDKYDADTINAAFSNRIASAPGTGDGFLDIVFIGDNYPANSLGSISFNDNAKKIKYFILGKEPFKIREKQIRFHFVENNENLNCKPRKTKRTAGLVCDWNRARILVQESVPEYDKILIVHNILDDGGTAFINGDIGSVANGFHDNFPATAMHELSHTLGLVDEYDIGTTGKHDYEGNCTLNYPNAEWQNIVPYFVYNPPCKYRNYYSTSYQSIMRRSQTNQIYNTVSLNIINNSIDEIAGPIEYDGPFPNVRINNISDGDRRSGYTPVKYSLGNTKHLHRVELWVNNQIIAVDYHASGIFYITNLPNTECEITVKAVDSLGNSGRTATRIVNTTTKTTPVPDATTTIRPTLTEKPKQTSVPSSAPTPTNTFVPTQTKVPNEPAKDLCELATEQNDCGSGYYCDKTPGSKRLIYCKKSGNKYYMDNELSDIYCNGKCVSAPCGKHDYCLDGTTTTPTIAVPTPETTGCPDMCKFPQNNQAKINDYCEKVRPGQCSSPKQWKNPMTCYAARAGWDDAGWTKDGCYPSWSKYGPNCADPICICDCVSSQENSLVSSSKKDPIQVACPDQCSYTETRINVISTYCETNHPDECPEPKKWAYSATCQGAMMNGECTWENYGNFCTSPSCICKCVDNRNEFYTTPSSEATTTPEYNKEEYIADLPSCAQADINNDGIFNHIDFDNLIKSYNMKCSPGITIGNCGPLDTNEDGVINFIDLDSFTKRYYPRSSTCAL